MFFHMQNLNQCNNQHKHPTNPLTNMPSFPGQPREAVDLSVPRGRLLYVATFVVCQGWISMDLEVRNSCWPEWFKMIRSYYLVPETTILKWMFGETTISYVKNWNHPIETTTSKWMFEVPGRSIKNKY